MALLVQSDLGDVANANGYITVAFFKSYHDDRGVSYSPLTDDQIAQRIVLGSDFLDQRWRYKGTRLEVNQTTEFPRESLYDSEGNLVEGIPQAVKEATAEYAIRTALFQDAPAPVGGGAVKRERLKLDVLETETEYTEGYAGTAVFPAFPKPDLILKRAGFVVNSTRIERA